MVTSCYQANDLNMLLVKIMNVMLHVSRRRDAIIHLSDNLREIIWTTCHPQVILIYFPSVQP